MKNSTKAVVITIIFTAAALALTPVIWPDPARAVQPTSSQLPFFIVLSIIEDLALGLGMSFLILGYPMVKNVMPEAKKGAFATYIAIGWSLINWWPHVNLHRVNGEDFWGLIKIDYAFHVTLIVAGLTIAYYFWRILKRGAKESL